MLPEKLKIILSIICFLVIAVPLSLSAHDFSKKIKNTSVEFDPSKGKSCVSGSSAYTNIQNKIQTLLKSKLSVTVVVLGLLFSFFAGALHALSPGHGKTIVAAYLAGSKGTVFHAVFLGLVVTFAHTFSIIVIGVTVLLSSNYILPEKIYPYLALFSSVLITIMGIFMLLRAYRKMLYVKYEKHEHEHKHGHQHHYKNIIGDGSDKIRIWDLFALGIAGGIIPCYDAIVILLVAVSLNKTLYGLIIILFFGLGLATVLITIGIVFVKARSTVQNVIGENELLLYKLPVASAAFIIIIGLALCLQTFISNNIIRFNF